MIDPFKIGMLFFILYFFLVVTLVVAALCLRYVRKIASLTEERITELRQEQERLQSFNQEKYKGLEEELERERQERSEAQGKLGQEQQQRYQSRTRELLLVFIRVTENPVHRNSSFREELF